MLTVILIFMMGFLIQGLKVSISYLSKTMERQYGEAPGAEEQISQTVRPITYKPVSPVPLSALANNNKSGLNKNTKEILMPTQYYKSA